MAIAQLSAGKPIDQLDPKDLSEHIRAQWLKMLDKFADAAAEEAIKKIRNQTD